MRMMGHNVLAILVAAIAIYLIEYVIFAMMISGDQYMQMTGLSAEQAAAGASRMPLGFIPPVLATIGLSLVIKWRNASGWLAGLTCGLWMAVLFAFGSSLYPYVYGPHTEAFLGVNLAHLLVCYGAAGAILAAWK